MSIKDYIQGKKHGKEANRLERDALNDLFLQEALEGFDEVSGDHATIIDRLEKRFAHPAAAQQSNRRRFLYWSIAASILLLIGFGSYFLLETNRRSVQTVALVQPNEEEKIMPVDSPVLQPVQAENLQPESLIAEKVTKKAKSTPTPTKPAITHVQTETENADITQLPLSAIKETRETDSEVVVVGYGLQKKSSVTGAVAKSNEANFSYPFGEKEFQTWCQQKADKNVCGGQGAAVKVSFFIDKTGKPVEIKYKKYSCEEAKKDIENLLASSPVWTMKNRKVAMTIKW